MDEHELTTNDSYVDGKTYSIISNHPLALFIMQESPLIVLSKMDASLLINDSSARDETLDEYLRNPKHFNGICKFLATESRLFYSLGVRIDKLQHTVFMLQFFPHKVNDNKLPFTQAEYIENVMELYIVNTLGLYDRILELINLLYDLKIPNKSINKKHRIMDKLDDIKLLKELRLLDQIFSSIRKSRNSVVHESFYYNEELENIFQAEIRFRHVRDTEGTNAPAVAKRAEEIDGHYDEFVTDKMTDIYMNDSILTKTLKNIFDELYKQHLLVLKKYGYKQKPIKPPLVNDRRDSIRKHLSVHGLEMEDIMDAVDASSNIKSKDKGNATES